MKTYRGHISGDWVVTNDPNENAEELRRLINEYYMDGEHVLDLFLNWHGTRLVSEDMMDDILRVEFSFDEVDEGEEE